MKGEGEKRGGGQGVCLRSQRPGERLRDTEMREAGRALEGRAERDQGWGGCTGDRQQDMQGDTLTGAQGETHTDVRGRETL